MTEAVIADEVTLASIDTLIPYANNPKEHPDAQVKKIASSIKNYGWDQPIVVDEDNEIIKGHGRLQAAELLGLDKVPIISRTDLSDAEKKAARIADNKTAESAWIEDDLTAELDMLVDEFEAIELGYDDAEIDDLLNVDDDVPGIGDAEPLGLDEEFEVIVEVESEAEQEQVYQELTEEGYECRLNSM